MDVNVNVNYKPSEINGLFQEIEEMKRQRAHLKDAIDMKTEKIIDHIRKHGNVLAYKNDVPYVLSVKGKVTTKLDKAALASEINSTSSELNLIGVAELVEDQRVSSDVIKSYQYHETETVLKARKAKKSDIDLLGSRAL